MDTMKAHLISAILYTIVTALLLGIAYPLAVTAVAHVAFANKADGQLIRDHGTIIGSAIIGQPFTGTGYFHSRPSAAGTGYDASSSSGSNLAQTNKVLIGRITASVLTEGHGDAIPIDLVTASGSGLDPDITPAAAFYQASRVARERHLPVEQVRALVDSRITPRQFGLLGEARVNVLALNLALKALAESAGPQAR